MNGIAPPLAYTGRNEDPIETNAESAMARKLGFAAGRNPAWPLRSFEGLPEPYRRGIDAAVAT